MQIGAPTSVSCGSGTRFAAARLFSVFRLYVAALTFVIASGANIAFAYDILLTNDDGYGSYGNVTLKAALEAAGHTVYVSTPIAGQSGQSSAFNTASGQPVRFVTHVPNREWAVDGTPVDAVNAALNGLLPSVLSADKKVDLVIAGVNKGDNVATSINHSGTVGAAMYALRHGVAAIAVSVGHDYAGIMAQRQAQASGDTTKADALQAMIDKNDHAGADMAAALAVEVIDSVGPEFLRAGLALNINVPNAAVSSHGTRVTRSVNGEAFELRIQSDEGGGLVLKSNANGPLAAAYSGSPVPAEEFAPDLSVEGQAFAYGYNTISILDGNYDARASSATAAQQLACRLRTLAEVDGFCWL